MSTLYPVCAAHAHDRMPANRVIAVSANLILISGIDPMLGTSAMGWFGLDGLLWTMIRSHRGADHGPSRRLMA
ncbi:hypothetical protein [Roseicella sp. DB1501]|uniref:hypothetical protein n=1 Tax=Roseicella sp. DB1501 TaxID=2730925 RepID=UPI001492FACE|nr:hypothetical protein [Roseicella sp. DB1501]NOG73981.1 hypothetical protein [Roseicella sp. DB1501]